MSLAELLALLKEHGDSTVVSDMTSFSCPVGENLVVTEPSVRDLGPDGPVRTQLARGGRVVLLDVDAAAIAALAWAGLAAGTEEAVAGDNPLVRAEHVTGAGQGLLAGLTVSPGDAPGLRADPATCTVLAQAGDRYLAARVRVGAGELILLVGQWIARLDRADNEIAVIRAVSGMIGSPEEGAAEARRSAPGARPVHPTVPEVQAKDWDLSLLPEGSPLEAAAFSRAAGHAGRLLPADVHDALVDFADQGNAAGALLLRGVPVGDLPATPPNPTSARKDDLISEFALLTVGRRLGQPVGYAPEHGGALVQNISPVEQDADRQVSTSSSSTLAFHTEAAFHPHRARYLLLLCLRGDPAAATTLCSVDGVLAALSPADRSVLAESRFTTGIDESYVGGPSSRRSHPRPILTGDPRTPKLWLDTDLMRGVDDAAQDALDRLSELVAQQATGVVLEPGDLLIVDNDRAVHGRSPFAPRFDGTDRWLQRTFVVADHTAADGERDGRIVNTQFLA